MWRDGSRPTGALCDYGSMATIGRKAAEADLPFVKLTGALARWFWGLVRQNM